MEIWKLLISLSVIILLIIIGSSVVYKDNYALITGTISANNGSASVKYPSGFNNENCVIVSYMLNRYDNGKYGTGSCFDSVSYVSGAIPAAIILNESGITINIKNINIINGENPYVAVPSSDFKFKIVLMKLP